MSTWKLYDSLIASMPAEGTVSEARVTPYWTIITSNFGTGTAMTPLEPFSPSKLTGSIAGMNLAELAGYVKSWDFHDAALGLAAINSYRNRLEMLPDPASTPGLLVGGPRRTGIFGGFDDIVRGKRVTVIGHGPHIEELRAICDLTVLERVIHPGDVADTACEYVLPEQDFVFITASALENKTMPRLIELTKQGGGVCVVWGPSAPLGQELFEAGADVVLGDAVRDAENLKRLATEGCTYSKLSAYATSVEWFKDPDLAERFDRFNHAS